MKPTFWQRIIFILLLVISILIVLFVIFAPQQAETVVVAPEEKPHYSVEDLSTLGASVITTFQNIISSEWGDSVSGVIRFRGNPSHTFYGTGPFDEINKVLWRYPTKPMCSKSTALGETKVWCGTGWTGQPVVWERPDGITELIFGAYDGAVHFVNAETGLATREKFQTGDIIKGSVALDPDGFPLIYFGSRDNKLRILALDSEPVRELWSLDGNAVSPRMWNDDWDGTPLVMNDTLYEGGENGWFFTIKLNRTYTEDGTVSVTPHILHSFPGWTKALLKTIGDRQVSIESSTAHYRDRVYFTSSGGRITGVDINDAKEGITSIVFDYFVGDDTDASLVIDAEGMLYVATERERSYKDIPHAGEVLKLDPYTTENPLLWNVATTKDYQGKGGFWATPALHKGILYAPSHGGELFVLDTNSGDVLSIETIPPHAWSSPNIIDNKLVLATCHGAINTYNISDPRNITLESQFKTASGACIESTPAIWKGVLYVGSRDGYMYALD